ncbi:MAG: MarR family transcriptional regulator, partial [Planctomycetales bacterium]|nr:MarR family transcriptional regulator [Planctomycetales bacterium]
RRIDSLGYQLGVVTRAYDRRLMAALAALGVAPGQFPALMMLYEKDGLTQADLCRRIGVEQPTMANTLKRMERDGLIRRSDDDGDKRRSFIHLTDKARAIQADVVGAARNVGASAVRKLSPGEQDHLFALLAKLNDNLTTGE